MIRRYADEVMYVVEKELDLESFLVFQATEEQAERRMRNGFFPIGDRSDHKRIRMQYGELLKHAADNFGTVQFQFRDEFFEFAETGAGFALLIQIISVRHQVVHVQITRRIEIFDVNIAVLVSKMLDDVYPVRDILHIVCRVYFFQTIVYISDFGIVRFAVTQMALTQQYRFFVHHAIDAVPHRGTAKFRFISSVRRKLFSDDIDIFSKQGNRFHTWRYEYFPNCIQ